MLENLGFSGEAQALFERARTLARAAGHRQYEAIATGNLGLALHGVGRYPEAQALFERHRALAREIGDRLGEASASGNLGLVLRAQGRLAEARDHHRHHLELSREIGYRKGEALAERHLGYAALGLGALRDARGHFDRSLAATRQLGDRLNEWQALSALATLDEEEGDVATAGLRFEEADRLRREIGHAVSAADAFLSRGAYFARLERFEDARPELDAALGLARQRSVPDVEVAVLAWRTRLPGDEREGTTAAALEALKRHGEHVGPVTRLSAHWLLFQATGDRAHAREARRLLDDLLAKAPPECREAMRTGVRLHREILAG